MCVIKRLFVGMVIWLLMLAAAQANTVNLGLLGATPSFRTSTVESGFVEGSELVRFRVANNNNGQGGYNVSIGASNILLDNPAGGSVPLYNISPFNFDIYKAVGGIGGNNDVQLCNSCGLTWTSPLPLLGGVYYAVITGTTLGSLGGLYAITATATPVPLPASALLLATGLIGLVAVARRKRTDVPKAPSVAA